MSRTRPLLFLLLLAAAALAHAAPSPDSVDPLLVRGALLRSGLSPLNENDARAAINALTQKICATLGYAVQTRVEVFATRADLKAALEAQRIQVVLIGPWDLLALQMRNRIDTGYTTVIGGHTSTRWLLLARAERSFHGLADLRGKNVLVLHNLSSLLGTAWTETRLLELHAAPPPQFFSSYTVVEKPSAAVLPVFFGKADACIVDEDSFTVLRNLNPQVGRHLVAVEISEPFLNPVIALTRDDWASERLRTDVLSKFATLGDEPAGRQLLTLFKCDRLTPIQPGAFDTVEALFRRNLELRAKEFVPQ